MCAGVSVYACWFSKQTNVCVCFVLFLLKLIHTTLFSLILFVIHFTILPENCNWLIVVLKKST